MPEVFHRVSVDCVIAGGTRVSWELNRHFIDDGPYSFQLQVGHTGLTDADDWADVGAPVVDTYYAFDLSKRLYGKTLETHYRVELTSADDTYYSNPVPCDGLLSKRDWINAREIIRKESLRHRVLTSPEGLLLKARRYGPRCATCTDARTEGVTDSNCPDCYGTGYENGYFAPLAACYADVGLDKTRDHRLMDRGMEKQDVIQARFIGDPQLYSYDAWVNATSDERYYLHTVGVASQIRGVAIVFDAELRLAPFTDVIYTVPLDEESGAGTWQRSRQPRKQPALNYLEATLARLRRRGPSSKP